MVRVDMRLVCEPYMVVRPYSICDVEGSEVDHDIVIEVAPTGVVDMLEIVGIV